MESHASEIKRGGKAIQVPSLTVCDRTIVATGQWIKIASVYDEEWLEGEVVKDPELFLAAIRKSSFKADVFTFFQKLPHTQPAFKYHMEWDNVAAIPTANFKEWWDQLPQVTRKSVRRGGKRGVTATVTEFNDDLVRGIVGIHNETLMKQGEPFVFHGREFDAVKKDYGTYLDRSEFLGAYFNDELIGIIKIVYVGEIASIMEILAKERHYDKRPMNVLMAKAVEVCEKKGVSFLVYGKYVYGKKTHNSLTEFKRRTGFKQIDIPRYYIPLTRKGKFALKLKLHRGLLGILPESVISLLWSLRSRYYRIKLFGFTQAERLQDENCDKLRIGAQPPESWRIARRFVSPL